MRRLAHAALELSRSARCDAIRLRSEARFGSASLLARQLLPSALARAALRGRGRCRSREREQETQSREKRSSARSVGPREMRADADGSLADCSLFSPHRLDGLHGDFTDWLIKLLISQSCC